MSEQTRIEDARLRNLWRALAGWESGAEDVRESTGATFSDAWRLNALREVAAPELLDRWLRKVLTFRQLWRIVTDFPGDRTRQVAEYERRPRRGETERRRRQAKTKPSD